VDAATRGKPSLSWCEDAVSTFFERLALARVGQPESDHPLNAKQSFDMSHCVIACGRCGGVYGGDGVVSRGGKVFGRCPTRRCECK
jgi:hypothetical protein